MNASKIDSMLEKAERFYKAARNIRRSGGSESAARDFELRAQQLERAATRAATYLPEYA